MANLVPTNLPRESVKVTPSDTFTFTRMPRVLRAGSAGSVAYSLADDNHATAADATVLTNVAAGEQILGPVKKVWQTGTDVTGIVGYY